MTTYLHISLVVWAKQLSRKRLGVAAELDSESALLIASKLSSSTATANRLAAEIALDCAQLDLDTILGDHFRGSLNVEADALSRLAEGKEIPQRLRPLPRASVPPAAELFRLRPPSCGNSDGKRRRGVAWAKGVSRWPPLFTGRPSQPFGRRRSCRSGRRPSVRSPPSVVRFGRRPSGLPSFVGRSLTRCVPQPFRPKCSEP